MTRFDGYTAGNSRQKEMIEVLKQYQREYPVIPIMAINLTTYPTMQRSIYEPGF